MPGLRMQVAPPEPGAAVRVFGDTHGQLHDVRRMCALNHTALRLLQCMQKCSARHAAAGMTWHGFAQAGNNGLPLPVLAHGLQWCAAFVVRWLAAACCQAQAHWVLWPCKALQRSTRRRH